MDKEQLKAYNAAYYARNRERIRANYAANADHHRELMRQQKKTYRRNLKMRVLEGYGAVCTCCGETNPDFLSVDHVNGGGRAHRQLVGGGVMLYLTIVREGFPADYQILCYNCNLGRAFSGGTCPHKKPVLASP